MSVYNTAYTPIHDEQLVLSRQVADLQKELSSVQQENRSLIDSAEQYRSLIESMQDGVFVIRDRLITFANRALTVMLGYSLDEFLGMPFQQVIAPEDLALVNERYVRRQAGEALAEEYEIRLLHKDRVTRVDVNLSVRAIIYQGSVASLGTVKDITERHKAEAERHHLQEELIHAQAAALAELSTPLIPLTKEVVVMPLIGGVDSGRAQHILEALLTGVMEHHASTAIIDITGVPVVDTGVASVLLQATQAVKLLGAQVVLTGIRPEVAQTIVGLGIDLRSIVTYGSLQTGVAMVLQRARVGL
jgi:rsbT co-antagonist protein RsbR